MAGPSSTNSANRSASDVTTTQRRPIELIVFPDEATLRRFIKLARRRGHGPLVDRVVAGGVVVTEDGRPALRYRRAVAR